jgi:predicted dehydrogenase
LIKFGIISFAHMHANGYAWVLNQLSSNDGSAELVAVADYDIERARAKAKEFGATLAFGDYHEMLVGDVVDAVIVCSENARHAEEVIACLQAGKHVICEKPIGVNDDDLNRMRAALQKSSVVFQTAFVCRFSPAVMEATRRLHAGEFGQVKAISATNHGSYPADWFGKRKLSGGGAIMDHTVHAADVIRLITGDEFGSVRAFQGKNMRPTIEVEDNAIIYARMRQTGIPVSIDCSWSRPPHWPTWGDLTLTVLCERGVIKIDAFKPHIQVADSNGFSYEGLGEDLNDKLIRAFIAAVEDKTVRKRPTAGGSVHEPIWRADFEDGARAAAVAFAAYKSISASNAAVAVG